MIKRMLLSRTRKNVARRLKGFVFDIIGCQEVVDIREKDHLEQMMGFHGQFGEHQRFQFAFLKHQGLVPSNKLLEIGCGPLTAGIPIIDYLQPCNYVGVDVRNSVLDLSWQVIGKAKLSEKNPRLICSTDFGSTELTDDTFDFICSFSVLFHLSDDKLQSFLATVRKRLSPSGICYANVNTCAESSTWLEFPFIKRTIGHYSTLAAANGLKTTCLGQMGDLGFRLPGAERQNYMLSFTAPRF